jgi:hypothetical protein
MDFSTVVKKALPWIGAAATSNVPALITLAAQAVGSVLGVDVPATGDDITTAIANATPEQLAALRSREMDFKERMQAMGFEHEHEMRALEVEETKAYVADTASAREAFSKDDKVFWLGVCVLATFAVLMFGVMVGCFLLMTGYFKVDPNVAAICSGLIGTVVGYVAANAQQVVSYNFGSSKGSKDNGDRIGQALTETIKQAGAR